MILPTKDPKVNTIIEATKFRFWPTPAGYTVEFRIL